MDKLIYTAMTGAKHTALRQDIVANNLANLSTNGFRAEMAAFRTAPLVGPGLPTRAYAVESTPGADLSVGALQQTGRELDIAVQGRGWLAVQAANGQERYTRNGHLVVNNEGVLATANGQVLLGEAGPIAIPADQQISIADEGTVTATPLTGAKNNAVVLGRLKLVNPDDQQLQRMPDGLFQLRSGQAADADRAVRIASGYLESSNVNAVDQLVQMISAARQFETNLKLIQLAQQNSQKGDQLLAQTG
ncbi:flagellar basal-body rod protein FlgF [Parvibium lacunae]|uniref:Flagellar basal-body rod protein FlgF n=1 Tax=Parvibium lacunae TaxID=1888893 RepID=A0A368L3N9_9BURK|nr:flagellar basal-body rod protein FlgF [Parvibium lacunae]RCS58197.1 flagellar basal-body rod protein FlgF [Parvibium lacunae]